MAPPKKDKPSSLATFKITASATKGKAVATSTNYLKPEGYENLLVETLQAIEAQIPPLRLIGKSWANIAEEEEDKPVLLTPSQLQQIIAQKKQESLIIPSTKKKSQTPNYPKSQQINNIGPILPKAIDEDATKCAEKLFSKNWHFVPQNVLKDRRFYELILVYFGLVMFKHHLDDLKEDKTHSTVRIEKVLSLKDWGQPPYQTKKFSINYNPIGYSYWDYISAWENVLYIQNKNFSHTWLLFFNQSVKYYFPPWFLVWWVKFGPTEEMLPEKVKEGFLMFKSLFNNKAFGNLPILLQFFSKIGLPWVYLWKYQFSEKGTTVIPFLQRLGFVRWWNNCQHAKKAHKQQVLKWFEQNPHFHKQAIQKENQFLQDRT
ncbi:hypothetical protein L6164_026332 [Bauhinia variegata]|uniref:Uncharacterized protein n=1 Tax=Bauhinia variegata TaxID=167791 RepID=A0ACB9LPT2_BAUVA|nr:hypothetical protein L6164_026332 [Bauhinia variegata]